MKFGKFLIWYLVFIHAIFLGFGLYALREDWMLCIVVELVAITSLLIGIRLYRNYNHTMNLVRAGIESIRNQDFGVKYLDTGQNDLDELIHVYNDMIDQLRLERIHQTEKAFLLNRLMDAMSTGVFWLDFEGNIEMINPSAVEILGATQEHLIGNNIKVLQGAIFDWLTEQHNKDAEQLITVGQKKYKCYQSHFIDRGFEKRYVLIEDISTEILETEKQAYGKIVRMMSHEVNNSSGAVNSILQSLLKANTTDEDLLAEGLGICIKRNKHLAQFMKNFAEVVRLPAPHKREHALQAWLKEFYLLQKPIFDELGIVLILESDGEQFQDIDVQQMDQVLMNIFKNARESIVEKQKHTGFSEGKVIIRLERKPASLSIIDNGIGISEAEQEHIFSVFYSTKQYGQGVGLTLSRDILSAHGFSFDLKTVGTQTTFSIHF